MKKETNRKRRIALIVTLVCFTFINAGALNILQQKGWLETAFATWQPVADASSYQVTYSGEGAENKSVDNELIRQYKDYYRVDVPGLKAGRYTLTVKALNDKGETIDTQSTQELTVVAQNREGFAFTGNNIPGGYDKDGTPKAGARIIYVTAKTVNTVTCAVNDKKGKPTNYTGLANILAAYSSGYDKTPLIIRMIGTIKGSEFDNLKDNNYVNFQGSNSTNRLIENITFEGVGDDATMYGYGFCFKRTRNIEIRNVGIMLFGDDAVSMDTDNTHIWVHNIDFFYGTPGSDADQVKGDGSIDMKYNSSSITISYNHFFDSGKVMGCGGTTGEDHTLLITYHHNWFDHADSRCPRLHYTTAHVYNNYYDGVPVYCIGNTTESSAFVEANYFRSCKRPMMISGQGTDTYDASTGTYTLKGTFSGQNGGMTKAYNNVFDNNPKLVYQTTNATQFDAYLVNTRDEKLPETVKSVTGGWAYSNFDTADTMYVSTPDDPNQVKDIVTTYAGRTNGGDFKWAFDNSKDDEDHTVNTELKTAILNYQSSLITDGGTTAISIISKSDTNADAKYYNVNGMKTGADTKGVVIRKCGGKTEKYYLNH